MISPRGTGDASWSNGSLHAAAKTGTRTLGSLAGPGMEGPKERIGVFEAEKVGDLGTADLRCLQIVTGELLTGAIDDLPKAPSFLMEPALQGPGADGQPLALNTPTVFNSGLNFRQFWDGRAATLEDQVDGPLLSPQEMNAKWADILAYLRQDRRYLNDFQRIYHTVPDQDSVRNAIATFERSLITPNSRFDQFLRGQSDALTEDEKQGYTLFKAYGCASCHQGVNVGGNLYQRLGIAKDYFIDRGPVQKVDLGRLNLTGRNRDRYVFKVPSLRNVELTAPYFHDGSIPTLESAVDLMATYQLGREIPAKESTQIVQFLKTLTGEVQF